MSVQLPNKGKTPSCHLRNCCREGGGGGVGGLDNTGVKREMLREGDGKTRQRECCPPNTCQINTSCALPALVSALRLARK